MFPISFNAFGDIVTAAQILYGIAKALSETYGAPAEYRSYVEDLHDMAAMMTQLHAIISSSGFSNAQLAQTLLTKIEECYLRVWEGLSRVAKFESLGIELEPGSASPGQVIRRGYEKVEWHIRRRGDVMKFREDMQIALQRLQIMMTFMNHSVTADIEVRTSVIHEETRATRSVLDVVANDSLRTQQSTIALSVNLAHTRVHVQTISRDVLKMVGRASAIQEDVRAARRDSVRISTDVQELDVAVVQTMGVVSAVHDDTQTLLVGSEAVRKETASLRADLQTMDRRITEMLQVLSAVQESISAVQSRLSGEDRPLPLERACPSCTARASKVGLPADYVWTLPCCGLQCHLLENDVDGACRHVESKGQRPSAPRAYNAPVGSKRRAIPEPFIKGSRQKMNGGSFVPFSPASSYAFDLESDQWVTDNGLQLHWQLLPHDDLDLDRPQLYFDVRYSMSRAFHVREGHGSSVSKTYLERLATRRPLARMTFTVFGLSACSIVIHRPQGVRVRDVLERIHELLQAPLSLSERETGRAARCLPHYEERVRQERLLDDSYVDVGMRRLDLLEGRFIFDGCQWRPPRERYPDGSWTLMFSRPVWKSHKETD